MGFFIKETEKGKEYRFGNIIICSLVFVLVLWSLTFVVIIHSSNPGEIGDSFGMMNALFSALAFALLILTSLMQSQELKLQREELIDNRKQLEKSAKAHEELVELTKQVNRDKLHPYLSINKFLFLNNNNYVLSFEVIGGPVKEISLFQKSSDFGYTRPSDDLVVYKEKEVTGDFQILERYLTKNPKVSIQYKTLDDRTFFQDIIFSNHVPYISTPKSAIQQLEDSLY